jgi:hypothetical protein
MAEAGAKREGFPYVRACLLCETSIYDDFITGKGVQRKRPGTICTALFAVGELHFKSSPLHQKVAEIPKMLLIAIKHKGQGRLEDEPDNRGVLDVHEALCEHLWTLCQWPVDQAALGKATKAFAIHLLRLGFPMFSDSLIAVLIHHDPSNPRHLLPLLSVLFSSPSGGYHPCGRGRDHPKGV